LPNDVGETVVWTRQVVKFEVLTRIDKLHASITKTFFLQMSPLIPKNNETVQWIHCQFYHH
jgi:hypothetical protein